MRQIYVANSIPNEMRAPKQFRSNLGPSYTILAVLYSKQATGTADLHTYYHTMCVFVNGNSTIACQEIWISLWSSGSDTCFAQERDNLY